MYQDDEDNSQRLGLVVIGLVTAAVVLAVVGFAVWGNSAAVNTGSTSTMAASETATSETMVNSNTASASALPTATNTPTDSNENRIVVENGVVKFYFASGSSTLATGANEALADVVSGVSQGKTAVVSGFHDSTGNAQINEEISKQRALAVRDALTALGVTADKITLRKPEVSQGTGDAAEARRVEVVLE